MFSRKPLRPNESAASTFAMVFCERLEDRRLLSTINWVNRGSSTSDTDGFTRVFGSLANQARAVIDADITYWQRTITNFNYSNGTNTYSLTVQMNSTSEGSGNGFVGANTSVNTYINGVPSAATIGIGYRTQAANGDSESGWYLDPTPMDNSEFQGSVYNAFGAAPSSGNPSGGGFDLLTIGMHEMCHAMGLSANPTTGLLAHDTGFGDDIDTPPPATPVADYWRVDGTNLQTLWTGFDSGGASGSGSGKTGPQHAAPNGAHVTVNGVTYYGETDLMTPLSNQRTTISNNDAQFLADAYGYTIALPSTFGTFYDQLDSNGTLRITGTTGNDTISVEPSGSNWIVSMTLGSPVVGMDPTTLSNTFAQSAVKGISILGLGGDDNITFPLPPENETVTVDGGSGTNSLVVDDSANTISNAVYHVSGTTITRTKGGTLQLTDAGSLELETNQNASTVFINSTTIPTTIYSRNTCFVSIGSGGSVQSIFGSIHISNPASYSSVTIDDSADTTTRSAMISDGSITNLAPAAITWTLLDLNALTIDCGSGGNFITIASASNNYTTYLNSGAGGDIIYLNVSGGDPSGTLSIDGQSGTNSIGLVDSLATAQTYSVTATGFSRSGLSITENSIATTGITGGSAADTFNVSGDPDNATLDVTGGDGIDSIDIGATTHLIPSFPAGANFDGGASNANLIFDNSAATAASSATFSGISFNDGDALTFLSMSNVSYDAGPGGSTIALNSGEVGASYTIDGGAGNDNVTVGTGMLSAVAPLITVLGGAGNDTLFVDDHSNTANNPYTFNNTNVLNADGVNVAEGGFESYTLSCGSGNNNIFDMQSNPVTVLGNAGNDLLDAEGQTSGHITPNCTFDGGAGLNTIDANIKNSGSAIVNLNTTQNLSQLNIGAGGDVVATQGAGIVVNTKALQISGGNSSYFDLNDNDMIVDYTGATQLPAVAGWINSAYNNGAWTGRTGILSTTAKNNAKHITMLGAMEASDYQSLYGTSATFDGQTIDNTAVLIKYTYFGDANFNGKVDGGDYALMDITFGKEATQGNIGGWFNGDFDGDGRVNGSDYGLADLAFGAQSGTLNRSPALPPAFPPGRAGNANTRLE